MARLGDAIWRLLWPESVGLVQVATGLVFSTALIVWLCSAAQRQLVSAASRACRRQVADPENQALLGGRHSSDQLFSRKLLILTGRDLPRRAYAEALRRIQAAPWRRA